MSVALKDLVIERERTSAAAKPAESGPAKGMFRQRINDRDKAEFCTQLAVMLKARVSLLYALEVINRQTTKKPMKEVVTQVAADVRKGSSLDRALAMHPEVFDQLFVVTAEVGQESGRLPEVLTHLASHLEKINVLKRKVVQALAYPALVLTVATIAVTFLLVFIVPTFAEMFRSFQLELPFTTRLIMGLSGMVSQYGLWLVVVIAVGIVLSRETLRLPATRSRLEKLVFRIPLVGDVITKNHVARFCRTLGTLLQAQVSLVDALAVTQRIATNNAIKKQIASILKHVRGGHTFSKPLEGSEVFPPMVVQMIAVGEETSELDLMLLRVADYYEQEIDGRVETLSSVMEPVLVLFLGIIVGAILISMYLPMFDLVNVVGGGG
jgi:type IV pilus assembly protein PilC